MNAVVTLSFGDAFLEMEKLTHPNLKAYADKIGADFHVISERAWPSAPPCYEKLQVARYLEKYERIVYLDTDILVQPHCPNLFDVVPLGMFGAFCEGKFFPERRAALQRTLIENGHDFVEKYQEYVNAGVMVFDRSHKSLFDLPPVWYMNFQDQGWINLRRFLLFPNKLMDIGYAFNHMISIRWHKRFESNIIHYAGYGKQYIKEDWEKLCSTNTETP
jgi:lipopolysaccharide biosynthesis glycosyltransferase